jgi:hypothetical protein
MLFRSRAIVVLSLAASLGCQSLARLTHRQAVPEPPKALAGFNAVEISGVPVDVMVGGAFEVAIPGALAQDLEARVESETLVITAKRILDHAREAGDGPRVRVSLPELRRVTVNGAEVAISGVTGRKLALEATGRSRLVVAGSVDGVDFRLANESRGDGRQLKVRTATVRLDGASRLDLRPDRAVSGEAKGASKLAVWSRPKRVGVAILDTSTISYVR